MEQTFGYIKDAIDHGIIEDDSTQEHADYVENLNVLSECTFGRRAHDFHCDYTVPFYRRHYWDWNLPRPADHTEPEWSDSEGAPSGTEDITGDVNTLRKQQKGQDHPAKDKAKILQEAREKMARARTARVAQTNTNVNTGDNSGGGGGGAANTPGTAANNGSFGGGPTPIYQQSTQVSFVNPGGGGGGGGDDSDSSDDSRRRRKSRKSKKSRKRKRSSSSSSSDDDDLRYKCKSDVCTEKFRSKAERNQHLDECQLYYGDARKETPWGWAGNDMNKYRVTYHRRKFPEFVDDNQNALHKARWLPYPSSHTQACAAQPTIAEPPHHNIPADILGVSLVCV